MLVDTVSHDVVSGGYLASGGSTCESSGNESTADGNPDFPSPCSKRHVRCLSHSPPRGGKDDLADKLNVWKQILTEKLVTRYLSLRFSLSLLCETVELMILQFKEEGSCH